MRTLKGFIAILTIMIAGLAVSAQTKLVGLDGSTVDVQRQTDKVVVLAIGVSWLPLSKNQAEFTNALAKKYGAKNVVVYFVATDSTNARSNNYASNDQLKSFAVDKKLSVTILRDSEGVAMRKSFHVEQLPSFVILDRSGNMAGEPFGGIDPKYDITIPISKVIDRLL